MIVDRIRKFCFGQHKKSQKWNFPQRSTKVKFFSLWYLVMKQNEKILLCSQVSTPELMPVVFKKNVPLKIKDYPSPVSWWEFRMSNGVAKWEFYRPHICPKMSISSVLYILLWVWCKFQWNFITITRCTHNLESMYAL